MTQTVPIRLDLEEIEREKERIQQEEYSSSMAQIRSTFFKIGEDPRVSSEQVLAAPTFDHIRNLKDNLDNIYLKLQWKIKRTDMERGEIIGFNIYKKRFSKDEILRDPDLNKRRLIDFDARSFDRISENIKKTGHFSEEKKGFSQVRKSNLPGIVLNNNLYTEDSDAAKLGEPNPMVQGFQTPGLFNFSGFEKLVYIDYSNFLKQEQRKMVVIRDRRDAILTFDDKSVAYNNAYEYYITSVSKNSNESSKSNSIKLRIEDFTAVKLPYGVIAKQVDENTISISVDILSYDNVKSVFFYRKTDTSARFKPIIEIPNIVNRVTLIDNSVLYGKNYTYRIFLQNIFGNISAPSEVSVFSSVQGITPQSRSNNLKSPLFTVVQDQNSDSIKITISPNDPLVAYYELHRKDLTINERKFSVPSKNETNYGGDGWKENKFFVKRIRNRIDSQEATSDSRVVGEEIIFIDGTVDQEHTYQYRIRGYDLFQNPTSYDFALISTRRKKRFRAPINLQATVLRKNPFRVKITWKDDNVAILDSNASLFRQSEDANEPVKVLYKIQRRKFDSNKYETFPITANQFMVDEVASYDVVDFTGEKTEDTIGQTENITADPLGVVDFNVENIKRPYLTPDFLEEGATYFYRISVLAENGEESNYTSELKVATLAEISDPIDFKIVINNVRVNPIVGILTWGIEETKALPDHWVIERKIDDPRSSFQEIGKAYIKTEFLDKTLGTGQTYIYRIRSVDLVGRQSKVFETRVAL